MVVQIGALRHLREKCAKFKSIRAGRLESPRRALFGSRLSRGCALGGGLGVNVRRAKQKQGYANTVHLNERRKFISRHPSVP
jgi:hypothetical protein